MDDVRGQIEAKLGRMNKEYKSRGKCKIDYFLFSASEFSILLELSHLFELYITMTFDRWKSLACSSPSKESFFKLRA